MAAATLTRHPPTPPKAPMPPASGQPPASRDARGDARDLAALLGVCYAENAPALLRVAMGLMRHPQEAEDLLAQTFMRALTPGDGQFDMVRYRAVVADPTRGPTQGRRLLMGYLHTVMARLACDWWRRRRHKVGHPLSLSYPASEGLWDGDAGGGDAGLEHLDVLALVGSSSPGEHDDPAEIVQRREETAEALAHFTPRVRRALQLRAQGYETNEAAAAVNMTYSGLRTALHRTRPRLATAISPDVRRYDEIAAQTA